MGRAEAERLLRLDMDDDKQKRMKPCGTLSFAKGVLRLLAAAVFRGEIHQEDRRRKFVTNLKSKKNKKS
jgi:hypothetical protein